MKLRPTAEREILEECIASGINYGLRRAYKHSDSPSHEHLEEQIYIAVLFNIDEKFDFEPDETRV